MCSTTTPSSLYLGQAIYITDRKQKTRGLILILRSMSIILVIILTLVENFLANVLIILKCGSYLL